MPIWEPDDELAGVLSALRVHDAPAERVERIREQCLVVLVSSGEKNRGARANRLAGWRGWLEPAFALGLGALYLAEAVSRALAVYR